MAEKTVAMPQQAVPAQAEAKAPTTTREATRYQVPPVDIFETGEGLTVLADLPGVEKEDLDIRVDNDMLTIRGKVKPVAKGDTIYTEYALLDYFRQFQLSDEVDQGKITAELKNGVLRLHLPKAEAAKPKQIAVQVA